MVFIFDFWFLVFHFFRSCSRNVRTPHLSTAARLRHLFQVCRACVSWKCEVRTEAQPRGARRSLATHSKSARKHTHPYTRTRMTMVGIPVSDPYRVIVSALAETSIGRLTRTRGDQVEGAASQLEHQPATAGGCRGRRRDESWASAISRSGGRASRVRSRRFLSGAQIRPGRPPTRRTAPQQRPPQGASSRSARGGRWSGAHLARAWRPCRVGPGSPSSLTQAPPIDQRGLVGLLPLTQS